jgi:nicotinamide mononucleotide (NMN) deamidase PncC
MSAKSKLLPRKRNKDGSYDSVCLTCFAIVGGCGPDGQLPEHDKGHVCDSAFFAERGLFTRTESNQHPHATPPNSQAA